MAIVVSSAIAIKWLTLPSYGVSSVYLQQCGYVLADAQAAQNSLRALIKSSRNDDLDLEAGKSR